MPELLLSDQLSGQSSVVVPARIVRFDWLQRTAFALFIGGLSVSFWLGVALVPGLQRQSTESHWLLMWHAWLLQFAVLLIALLLLLVSWQRQVLISWWNGASPDAKAAALCAPMIGLELFFAAGFWFTRGRPVSELGYLRAFFWLGREFNGPAIFSVLQLALVAALAWACYLAWRARRVRRHAYAAVAILCLYMSADELLMLHERVGSWVRVSAFSTADDGTVSVGPLKVYVWILVYAPLALICGAILGRIFWRDLRADGSFLLLFMAGFIFLAGAVGAETLNSHGIVSGWHQAGSIAEQRYILYEEMMEMFGVTLAVYLFARSLFRLDPYTVKL